MEDTLNKPFSRSRFGRQHEREKEKEKLPREKRDTGGGEPEQSLWVQEGEMARCGFFVKGDLGKWRGGAAPGNKKGERSSERQEVGSSTTARDTNNRR